MSLLQFLQVESGFYGHCFTCGADIPVERLAKGADTCKPECQTAKRKTQRRFQKLIQLHRLLASPTARRLVKTQERTALATQETVAE